MIRITTRFGLLILIVMLALSGMMLAVGAVLPDAGQIGFVAKDAADLHVYLHLLDVAREQTIPLHFVEDVVWWQWSPDGNAIIYSQFSEGWAIVYYELRERRQIILSTHVGQVTEWSPDGQFILYFADSKPANSLISNTDIFLLDVSDGAYQQLTDGATNDLQQAWSPDGAEIAFVSWVEAGEDSHSEIFIMDADGENQRQLTDLRRTVAIPSWSPDGQSILFYMVNRLESRTELMVAATDSGDIHPVNRNDTMAAGWAEDGTNRIVFQGMVNGNLNTFYARPEIGTTATLFSMDAQYGMPVWSPDGASVAFVSNMGGTWSLYTANIDGSDMRQLMYNTGNLVTSNWSPDGQQVAFTFEPTNRSEFFIVNADGTNLRAIAGNDTPPNPQWRPRP